jgi:hypothetical protein
MPDNSTHQALGQSSQLTIRSTIGYDAAQSFVFSIAAVSDQHMRCPRH